MNSNHFLPNNFHLAALLVAVLILTGLVISTTSAYIGPSFSISWYTFDGGGGVSTGEPYTLMGTIGQPDAGSHSGTGYDLTGGFWAWVVRYLNFSPIIRKP